MAKVSECRMPEIFFLENIYYRLEAKSGAAFFIRAFGYQ